MVRHFSIRVEGLYKRFGKQVVLRNVSFIHKNGIFGIEGSNGSGKSTLMKCMAGLAKPTKGSVEWFIGGKAVELEYFKRALGYAAPYINLYNELTCLENLRFLLELRSEADKKDAILNALEVTAMKSFSDQPFGSLSTGQQQRLRIAAALVHQPQVLFLDEPGSNLDEAGRKMIETVVTEFKTAGKLVVIASNNRGELQLCDEIYSVEAESFNHLEL